MESNLQLEKELKAYLLKVSKIKIEGWKNKALNDIKYFNTCIRIGLTNEKPYCWRCSHFQSYNG